MARPQDISLLILITHSHSGIIISSLLFSNSVLQTDNLSYSCLSSSDSSSFSSLSLSSLSYILGSRETNFFVSVKIQSPFLRDEHLVDINFNKFLSKHVEFAKIKVYLSGLILVQSGQLLHNKKSEL